MNERIEQMMLEATKDMPQGYYVPGEYFQKFAELIIRECAGILEPKSRYMGEGPEVLKDKIRQINKHFGVE